MPKKKVEAHCVKRRGKMRWRVIIPVDLSEGKRRERYFDSRTSAETFAGNLDADRQAKRNGMPTIGIVESAMCRNLLERVGGIDKLCECVDFFLRHKPGKSIALGQLVRECITSKELAGRSDSYVSMLCVSLKGFARAREDKLADGVTPAEIEEWLHGHNWKPATKQGYLKDLRTLFSFALRKGYVTSNPALAVEMPQSENKAPGILTVSECRALMERVIRDPGMIPYFALCLFGGIRPSEVRRLTWERVKDGHVEIQAAKAKTKRRRLVTINPTLGAWLAMKGELPPRNFRRRFRAIISGLPWSHDCLRHSFVSYSLPVIGISKTAMEAGHSEQVLFAHYRELVTAKDAAEFWKIKPSDKTPPA
jgi:integrase